MAKERDLISELKEDDVSIVIGDASEKVAVVYKGYGAVIFLHFEDKKEYTDAAHQLRALADIWKEMATSENVIVFRQDTDTILDYMLRCFEFCNKIPFSYLGNMIHVGFQEY